jgi:hypothetical protein
MKRLSVEMLELIDREAEATVIELMKGTRTPTRWHNVVRRRMWGLVKTMPAEATNKRKGKR